MDPGPIRPDASARRATMIGLWLMGIPLPLALGLLTALLILIPHT